jgi:catechol 2,3-dioxygenase-like lactoylglutathione lyase family enzyme
VVFRACSAALSARRADFRQLEFAGRRRARQRARRPTGDRHMRILEHATPTIVVCTRDRAVTSAFYRDTLGLRLISEDDRATRLALGGAMLEIAAVADFEPHGHTIFGFNVADVAAVAAQLAAAGVSFNRYPQFCQDEHGVLTLPSGTQVAWFNDPAGNVVSITDAAA